MDTTNYDTKMEELRAAAKNGQLTKDAVDKVVRVGRPKGPDKVVFKRNVEPALVSQLDALIKGDPKAKEEYLEARAGEATHKVPNDVKDQIKALLEDIESKDQIIKSLEEKIQKIARLTNDEKLILWIRKYDGLAAAFKELQFRCQE